MRAGIIVEVTPEDRGRLELIVGEVKPFSATTKHLHRTAMALDEVRVHLFACLLGRAGGPSGDRRLDNFYKPPASACRAWRRDAGQGISRKASASGPGLRPALYPTALVAYRE